MKLIFTLLFLFSLLTALNAQPANLITDTGSRNCISLNGKWHIIIDPYENGYYDYRYKPRGDGYYLNQKPKSKSDLVEYDFDKSETLNVPGDWNSQKDKLFFYEGTIWYEKSFKYVKKPGKRTFIYFGAANYNAVVYVNGMKLGEHTGGFTPFDFEVTDILHNGSNFVIVKIDNKRLREGVPTLNTDWWNYGGLTRSVKLIEVPDTFIQDYSLQLKKGSFNRIEGWVKINGGKPGDKVEVKIPEVHAIEAGEAGTDGKAGFSFSAKLNLWSPQNPKLYDVKIIAGADTITDKIGFRSIETKGGDIILNGKKIFLRGIAIHEEAPFRSGRAFSKEDDYTLLNWAKQLGCNYVRLAHYPHNENMVRLADKMGIMVWSEIPVYWTILWDNKSTLNNAENQLREMITRDKNRASVIIWSMANETPRGDERNQFLKTLIDSARSLDATRLITAATELSRKGNTLIIDDPLGNYLDVIGVNEYFGWYSGTPEEIPNLKWESRYNKPVIISELGAAALYGYHGGKDERWTEEYQADVYKYQIGMLKKIGFLRGVSPWILMDFRSPRRPLPYIQDFYNRKGLISNRGEKKQAFYILQNFYKELKEKNG